MDSDKSKKTSVKELFLKICIWLGVVVIVVFIILPTIFITIGNVFPNSISSEGALTSLSNGVNTLVGWCSLIVGVVSIVYAYISNQRVDEQQYRNEVFMKELSNKIDELQNSNTKIFDQVVNTQQSNTKQDNSK